LARRDADARERLADVREQDADARERLADVREQDADARERLADAREQFLDELARDLDMRVADAQRRSQEAIDRSQARLAAATDRLDRSEAALRRSLASAGRAQELIDRADAASERRLARQPHDPGVHIEQAKVLRRRLLVTAVALAAAEDKLVGIHEELASRRPAQASEHRAMAEAARKAALQARDIEQQLRG
jgi:hypothetical protein